MTFYLGITGGIATGKSTADKHFKDLGYNIIDADEIAHAQLKINQPGWQNIKKYFGVKFLNADQSINRGKLGQLVFNDRNALNKLNELNLPLIKKEIVRQMQLAKEKLVVVDVPLLFEINAQNLFDKTLVITASEKIQLRRLMTRNKLTRLQALARIDKQMPLTQKIKLADYMIQNDGDISQLNKKINQLIKQLPIKESDKFGMSKLP